MMKQGLVQDNLGHRLNFLISCNLKNTREPHGKEDTGNTGSQPTPATLFHCFLKLLKKPGLRKAYMSSTYSGLLKLEIFVHYWTDSVESHLKQPDSPQLAKSSCPSFLLKLKTPLWHCQGTWLFKDSYFLLIAISSYLYV